MSLCGWNTVLYVALGSFGIVASMLISLSEIGRILGLLPFSGVTLTVLRTVSMSIGIILVSSPILIPVSLSICSTVAVTFPLAAISRSISSSVGMNGSRSCGVYLGGFHVTFLCLR